MGAVAVALSIEERKRASDDGFDAGGPRHEFGNPSRQLGQVEVMAIEAGKRHVHLAHEERTEEASTMDKIDGVALARSGGPEVQRLHLGEPFAQSTLVEVSGSSALSLTERGMIRRRQSSAFAASLEDMASRSRTALQHHGRLATRSGALIATFDAEDRLVYANDAFRDAYRLLEDLQPTWAELMRRNWQRSEGAAIRCGDFESWLASAASRRGKMPYRAFETELRDGRWLWMTETVDAAGWMLCIATDITPLAVGGRALRESRDLALRAAQTDELTGVANRRAILARLDAALVRGAPACAALVDLDRFKHINDRHGHLAGDDVLVHFAHRMMRQLGRAESFGRLGGEEFLFVLPQVGLAQAEAFLNRCREAVRGAIAADGLPITYTFSAGVTAVTEGDDASAVLARSDRACYRAKAEGRDRVVVE